MIKLIITLSFCLVSIIANAQNQEIKELMALAEQGVVDAQYNLGRVIITDKA